MIYFDALNSCFYYLIDSNLLYLNANNLEETFDCLMEVGFYRESI